MSNAIEERIERMAAEIYDATEAEIMYGDGILGLRVEGVDVEMTWTNLDEMWIWAQRRYAQRG